MSFFGNNTTIPSNSGFHVNETLMSPAPLLTFLIPAYNEAARLGRTLEQVLRYLNKQAYASEVLVVDDGSTDETVKLAESYLARYAGRVATRIIAYQPNQGKGYAVRQGLLAARGVIAVFSDADLSTPIAELPRIINPIVAGHCDVVFGSRLLDPRVIGVPQPLLRKLSGRLFNMIMRVVTGLPYEDTQCGFKAFRLDVCRPVVEGAVLNRFGFDVELLCLAHRAGLRLLEQPVRWNDVEGSKVSILSGLDGFRELQQLRRRTRQGHYDETMRRTHAACFQASLVGPAAQPAIDY
jgi:dolichyl-phosphate beta-glucosyltransferase